MVPRICIVPIGNYLEQAFPPFMCTEAALKSFTQRSHTIASHTSKDLRKLREPQSTEKVQAGHMLPAGHQLDISSVYSKSVKTWIPYTLYFLRNFPVLVHGLWC